MTAMNFRVRAATPIDAEAIAELMFALWPDEPLAELRSACEETIAGRPASTMPLALFVAEDSERRIIGFVEVGLRSHADGCDGRQAVGFVEGWYVKPAHQRTGVGRALIEMAEEWSRARGCIEIGSDTWLDNEGSELAHRAIGFEVVDRCVHFRKALR